MHNPASVTKVTVGGQVITGVSASVTITVCEQLDVLPLASVAVHVTVVVPSAYGAAGIGPETVTPLQLSVAVAVPIDALDVHEPASVLILTVEGQLITGNSESVTVTVCEHIAVLPLASVAVHTTVVVPTE